jgi:hypothetical protein
MRAMRASWLTAGVLRGRTMIITYILYLEQSVWHLCIFQSAILLYDCTIKVDAEAFICLRPCLDYLVESPVIGISQPRQPCLGRSAWACVPPHSAGRARAYTGAAAALGFREAVEGAASRVGGEGGSVALGKTGGTGAFPR